jgi:hypothetical protein
MNQDLLFKLANNLALVGWLFLVVLPGWRWSARLIAPTLIPAALAGLYLGGIPSCFLCDNNEQALIVVDR